jgi:hypothetical protein
LLAMMCLLLRVSSKQVKWFGWSYEFRSNLVMGVTTPSFDTCIIR